MQNLDIESMLIEEVAAVGQALYDEVVAEIKEKGTVLTQEQTRVMNDLRTQIAACKKLGIV